MSTIDLQPYKISKEQYELIPRNTRKNISLKSYLFTDDLKEFYNLDNEDKHYIKYDDIVFVLGIMDGTGEFINKRITGIACVSTKASKVEKLIQMKNVNGKILGKTFK